MNVFSLKNSFWLVLALTVIVGSIFDFIALRQTEITKVSGEMVVLSYQIIDETNKISRDFEQIEESLEGRSRLSATELKKSLRTHLDILEKITASSPEQQAEVERLSGLLKPLIEDSSLDIFSEAEVESIRQSLRKIEDAEENFLKARLESDQIKNTNAQRQVLFASLSDILLLGLMAFIWVTDSRRQRSTERTLGEALRSISRANIELEQASMSKTQLLKATAHDLRNPLGSIKGLADLIAEESSHPSVTEMSGIIRQVSLQTLELVNTLVDPKALATGKPENHIVSFDLAKCLTNIRLSQGPLALQKNQSLHFDHDPAPLMMEGDAGKIWELFTNLVGNAIKFSPPGGHIYLRAKSDAETVCVEIEDQGPGFTAEDKAKAFQKYQRLSAQPTGGEASSGLGLSLVKEIVDLHHGQIEILDAQTGKGTCFQIRLPRTSAFGAVHFDPSPTIGI